MLLRATRDGEPEAFGEFYERWRALVLAYLRRRVVDAETAGDLLGETFAAALLVTRDPERPIPEEPAAWLMAVARNKLIDSIRRGRVEGVARERLALQRLEIDDGDIARIDELSAATDVVGSLQELLSADQHAALRARILDELEYADIARDLRCSESVVRKRVSRALRTLRGALEAPE